ncbi:MAG: DUF502 domain-containing protein [Candidatus Babeliales bacterium]
MKRITTTIRFMLERLYHLCWSIFINGLFTVLPITVTLGLFSLSFRLIQSWLEPIRTIKPAFLSHVPYSEFLLVITFIFVVGVILRLFILQHLIQSLEQILFALPLIRPVYSGIKQLIYAFGAQDSLTFKKVVLVEFPRKGMFSLGFLTSELPKDLRPDPDKRFYNIFIPTTPNPTSGYFIIVEDTELKSINLTQHEAMALIISGGIIQPERFLTKKH